VTVPINDEDFTANSVEDMGAAIITGKPVNGKATGSVEPCE
jgi:hypothetical protein